MYEIIRHREMLFLRRNPESHRVAEPQDGTLEHGPCEICTWYGITAYRGKETCPIDVILNKDWCRAIAHVCFIKRFLAITVNSEMAVNNLGEHSLPGRPNSPRIKARSSSPHVN